MAAAGPDRACGSDGSIETPLLRVGVVVATLGRSSDCETLIDCLMAQTRLPDAIVLSTEKVADLPGNLPPAAQVVMGPRGLCAQRNRGVAAVANACDVIVFFDDDFLPGSRSIESVAELFATYPDVVGATGKVLADGVTQGGIGLEDARKILAEADARKSEPVRIEGELKTAYGCNMAFRASAMRGHAFDERLPLYGWQEDVDFAGQLAKVGRIVSTNAMIGVHRGVIGARAPGVRLGFSQVVNPIYLVRKGTMRRSHAARLIVSNLLANHAKALAPEEHIDRAGRLRGNWRALGQVLRGRIEPLDMLKIN